MQNSVTKVKKSLLSGLFALLLWMPLPWLYFNPPWFLQGQPLSVYAIVLFLSGISMAALALFFVLKPRISFNAARLISILFLLTGIGAYQFSGFAPNWNCLGKQIYIATANAAGQNCTTTCTSNKQKPCSGWSTCWDKFVSCSGAGKDQDGRNCKGCCFSCDVVCEPPPQNDQPPTVTSSVSCTQTGDNGWCIGAGILTLTASDPQNYTLTISGDIGGTPFTCAPGNACFQPLPQGNGTINYTVTAAQSGMSGNGSTTWSLDATPPSLNGTLSGALGSNDWYLGSVTYNGSASDALSGLASLTCSLDGSQLDSCNTTTISTEGVHTLSFTAKDNAGNTQTFNQAVSLDLQNPNLTSSISGTLGSNGWYNAAALSASASDPALGSGLSTLEYNLDNSGWIAFPALGSLDLTEGVHSIEVRAMDAAGRITTSTKSYSLDAMLPAVTLNPSGTLGNNNWYTSNLTISASASDPSTGSGQAGSGMDIFEYSLDDGAWTTYATPLTLTDGAHTISFWAQDLAGLVSQVDENYKVDTRPPHIAGSLNGAPGANGWYVSQVTISASAADPVPGSGLDALTYILNGGAQTAYTNPLTLSDGEHSIQFNAGDFAGLTYTMTQTVKVDTTAPSLNVATMFPLWSKNVITLNGAAGDGGSGLSKVEISTDGVTWQTVNGAAAWTYDWDTTTGTSGMHQVHVRATDNAGLMTEQVLDAGVDNSAPKISLPDSWFQWDTVTLDAWDNDSGLSYVRVEIRDPEGRWKTRKIDLDLNSFPLDFKWDRRFGDGTIAPMGTYSLKMIAYDNLGNETHKTASIKILLGILPPGPASTPQPYVRVDSTPISASPQATFPTPIATSAPVTNAFGSTPEPSAQIESTPTAVAIPRAAPTKTTVTDWLKSVFLPSTTKETTTEVNSPEANTDAFNYATYAAMTAAVTAYTLAEKKRKEEEERKRAEEASKHEKSMSTRELKEAKKRAALQKIWDANGAAIYEANQAFKSAHGVEMDAGTKSNAIKDATMNGVFDAGVYAANLTTAKAKEDEARRQAAQNAYMEGMLTRFEQEEEAHWLAQQKAGEEKNKVEDLQAGLAAYYSATRQG